MQVQRTGLVGRLEDVGDVDEEDVEEEVSELIVGRLVSWVVSYGFSGVSWGLVG